MIFILGTYHGKAASNAAQFLEWIQSEEPGQLKDVEYAVYGVGESGINRALIRCECHI